MKRKPKIFRLIWIFLSLIFLIGALAVVLMGFYIQASFQRELPSNFDQLSIKGESPRFYIYRFADRANRVGEEIEVTNEVFAQKQSTYVSYPNIPKDLINAFVAIEDKRFFEHEGVDWYRTLAAR